MRVYLVVFVFISFLVVGCSGSGKGNPILPDSTGNSRALALYTMTFSPALVKGTEARSPQDYRGAYDLVPENTRFPYKTGDNFELAADLVDYEKETTTH